MGTCVSSIERFQCPAELKRGAAVRGQLRPGDLTAEVHKVGTKAHYTWVVQAQLRAQEEGVDRVAEEQALAAQQRGGGLVVAVGQERGQRGPVGVTEHMLPRVQQRSAHGSRRRLQQRTRHLHNKPSGGHVLDVRLRRQRFVGKRLRAVWEHVHGVVNTRELSWAVRGRKGRVCGIKAGGARHGIELALQMRAHTPAVNERLV